MVREAASGVRLLLGWEVLVSTLHGAPDGTQSVRARSHASRNVGTRHNEAEQAPRQAVIWWKLSFGTQSPEGSRFVERLLTVVETCRR